MSLNPLNIERRQFEKKYVLMGLCDLVSGRIYVPDRHLPFSSSYCLSQGAYNLQKPYKGHMIIIQIFPGSKEEVFMRHAKNTPYFTSV